MVLTAIKLVGFLAAAIVIARPINRVLITRFGLRRRYLPIFGWGFAAFVALHLGVAFAGVPFRILAPILTALAIAVPVIALVRARRRLVRAATLAMRVSPILLRPSTLLLLAAVTAILFAVGIYLEFPSDPLAHLDRIQRWTYDQETPFDNRLAAGFRAAKLYRPAYALYHWQLDGPPPLMAGARRLDLLGAAMAAILLFSLMRVAAVLGAGRGTVWLAGATSLAFFGHNLFSFFRYYVLSPAFWAYVIFLEALVLVLGCFRLQRFRYLAPIPLLVPAMWLDHPQEVLLLVCQGAGLAAFFALVERRTLEPRFRRRLDATLLAGAIAVAAAALWAPPSPPNTTHVSELTVLGVALPLHSPARSSENLGVAGWLAMLGAATVLLRRRAPRDLRVSAALCIWPLLLLSAPPTAALLIRWVPTGPLYRLLYGSLFWLFLGLLAAWLAERPATPRRRHLAAAGLGALLLTLACWPAPPVYGRMPHLLSRVDPRLDGRNLRPVVDHLLARTDACRTTTRRGVPLIISGAYVNTVLHATGRFRTIGFRYDRVPLRQWIDRTLGPPAAGDVREPAEGYRRFLRAMIAQGACYVVIYRPPEIPVSWIQTTSHHWRRKVVDSPARYPPALHRWLAQHPEVFVPELETAAATVYRVHRPPPRGN